MSEPIHGIDENNRFGHGQDLGSILNTGSILRFIKVVQEINQVYPPRPRWMKTALTSMIFKLLTQSKPKPHMFYVIQTISPMHIVVIKKSQTGWSGFIPDLSHDVTQSANTVLVLGGSAVTRM